ncbi:LPD23 domain-containing protein [Photobacterium damselae]|uniref:LPD23 domain-containing protein n=1 Tax=Photobacterium damselae TaxID=38293 RepID=UPI0040678C67
MAKYNQFAGVNALSHDAQSLARAVALSHTRATREEIYERTGWFKDADQKWKFEIADNEARLIDGWREAVAENNGLPLDQVLSHDKLFENYPHMRDLVLKFGAEDCDYWGELSEIAGVIRINPKLQDDGVKVSLCHETNHYIQYIEKFGVGGASGDAGKNILLRNIDTLISAATTGSGSIYRTARDSYSSMIEMEESTERMINACFMRDAEKLVNYAHSASPSRAFRHVRNALTWLWSDKFKDAMGETRQEVREIYDAYQNIPKSNHKGQRNEAIADVCIRAAQTLRGAVPPQDRYKMTSSERSFESIVRNEKRKIDKLKGDVAYFCVLENEVKDLIAIKERVMTLSGSEIYRALNGEVTSKATEKRMLLTDSERMERPPWFDMLSHNEQIAVKYAHGYMFNGHRSLSAIEQVSKASIEFGNDYFAKMLLHPLSDASSVMHESAHYFLEVMSDLNARDGVKQALRDDFNDVLNYLGTSEIEWYSMDSEEKEPYHEKFAEGFEDYLINGEPRNCSIAGVFKKLKGWLSAIYAKFGASKLASSEGAEQVYERILSSKSIDMAQHNDLFAAIEKNISGDVKEAADAVYGASMGYFSEISGLTQEELTHRYDLVVEWDGSKEKNSFIHDEELATMSQCEYESLVEKNGFGIGSVYYHGTSQDFEKFDESFFNKNERRGDYIGCGFYFTKNKETALKYAKQAGGDIVKEVFLKQMNPLIIPESGSLDKSVYDDIDASKYFDEETEKLLGENAKYYATFEMQPSELADYMKSKGYDGLMDNSYDQVAVFDASRIMPASVDELRASRGVDLKEDSKIKNKF